MNLLKQSPESIFSRAVRQRDGACTKCGSTERLHAVRVRKDLDPRDINCATTLCDRCRKERIEKPGRKR